MISMIMIDRLISSGKFDPGGGLNLEGTGKYAPCLLRMLRDGYDAGSLDRRLTRSVLARMMTRRT